MKAMSLLVTLIAFSGDASLGIGVDVLPEAYGFAGRKIGFPPNLHLKSCTSDTCLWTLDPMTTLTATFEPKSLATQRLVVESGVTSNDHAGELGFQRACLTLVVLIQPASSPSDQQLIALTLSNAAAPVSIDVDNGDVNARFFGDRRSTPHDIARCGVVVRANAGLQP